MNQVITMIDLEITPPLQRETVRSYVYRMLYDNIMSLHLPPGLAMSEQEVADLLKTSRTPVREAFIHLGQDHLLDILPQRGTFVARLHTQMIREARFMRVVMEEAVMASLNLASGSCMKSWSASRKRQMPVINGLFLKRTMPSMKRFFLAAAGLISGRP